MIRVFLFCFQFSYSTPGNTGIATAPLVTFDSSRYTNNYSNSENNFNYSEH